MPAGWTVCCQQCRELDWALYMYPRLNDTELLTNELLKRFHLSVQDAMDIAAVATDAYDVCYRIMEAETLDETIERAEEIPRALGPKKGLLVEWRFKVPEWLSKCFGVEKSVPFVSYRKLVPRNPSNFYHILQALVESIEEHLQFLESKLVRYVELYGDAVEDMAKFQRLLEDYYEGLRTLRRIAEILMDMMESEPTTPLALPEQKVLALPYISEARQIQDAEGWKTYWILSPEGEVLGSRTYRMIDTPESVHVEPTGAHAEIVRDIDIGPQAKSPNVRYFISLRNDFLRRKLAQTLGRLGAALIVALVMG